MLPINIDYCYYILTLIISTIYYTITIVFIINAINIKVVMLQCLGIKMLFAF